MAAPLKPGMSQTAIAELVRLYDLAARDMNTAVGRAILQLQATPGHRASQFALTRSAQLARELEQRLAALAIQTRGSVDPAVLAATARAIGRADAQVAELRKSGDIDPALRGGLSATIDSRGTLAADPLASANFEDRAIRKLAEDSAAVASLQIRQKLDTAAHTHAENARGLFRRLGFSAATETASQRTDTEIAINTEIARGLIAGNPRAIEKGIRQALGAKIIPEADALSYRQLGNQQIQVGGWTGPLRAYAQAVARTRSAEAANDAAIERMDEHGIEAATIQGSNSANFCTAFVGLVVGLRGPFTINGVTYPAASDLPEGGAPFHPNCSKGYAPFDPELSSPGRVALAAKRIEIYRAREAAGTLRERLAV